MKIRPNSSISFRHAGELNTARNELETMKDLLNTYEVSIERKDAVIANLTRWEFIT